MLFPSVKFVNSLLSSTNLIKFSSSKREEGPGQLCFGQAPSIFSDSVIGKFVMVLSSFLKLNVFSIFEFP